LTERRKEWAMKAERTQILAWYAYSESGAARLAALPPDDRGWQDPFSRRGLDGVIDLAKRRGHWADAAAGETATGGDACEPSRN
jgi:hypothetical protein